MFGTRDNSRFDLKVVKAYKFATPRIVPANNNVVEAFMDCGEKQVEYSDLREKVSNFEKNSDLMMFIAEIDKMLTTTLLASAEHQ